ncbi:MAG TPA: 50S ribosomal protein L18 [Candidatus Eisenbacteria bacterium]|nr:50S ribosomal protein L18 [Candidatus Eisenbacteria bacterium]
MSSKAKKSEEARVRRHRRVRRKVVGTPERPRLCVFRSLKHIYVQIFDDRNHRCLLTVSSLSDDVQQRRGDAKGKTAIGALVGQIAAEKAMAAGIEAVAFDRGGYLYHGRVKALADGARKAGLKF